MIWCMLDGTKEMHILCLYCVPLPTAALILQIDSSDYTVNFILESPLNKHLAAKEARCFT